MKVSIIIPVYNASKTLHKCLDSVINSEYKDIEVICVNDASTDDSLDILNEYHKLDKRIKVYTNDINSGPGITKSNGIKYATGDYLSFVDSDDFIEPNMISEMVEYATSNNLDIVRCNYQNYLKTTNITGVLPIETSILDKKNKDLFINYLIDGTIPGYMQLIMINKQFYYRSQIKLHHIYYLEDLLFYIQILSKTNKVGIINKPLYNYINNDSGLTFSKDLDKILKRIDGLLTYNEEVSKILPNKKKNIDSRTTYLLIHFIYELWLIKEKNKILETLTNKNITKIFKNSVITNYDTFTKISYKLIIKRHYTNLFIWFNIAKIVIKLKGIIRR